jgi:hypothetical protein
MAHSTLQIDPNKSEATIVLERSREAFTAAVGPNEPYQRLRQRLKRVRIDGTAFYVAEGDTLLDEDQLYFYALERDRQEKARQRRNMLELAGMGIANLTQPNSGGVIGPQPRGLVGILQNGQLVRWAVGKVLTYCVLKSTFGGDDAAAHYVMVVENMRKATRAWEKVCGVQFRYLPTLDSSPAGIRLNGVVFPVRELDVGGALIAAAFFPNDPLERRRVVIDPSYYADGMTYDRVGVLRHELGHVLGFRHEHIRSEAPPVCRGEDPEGTINLTDYSPDSVMHYFCGGVGSKELSITQTDRIGAQVVYGPPLAEAASSAESAAALPAAVETLFPKPANIAFVS